MPPAPRTAPPFTTSMALATALLLALTLGAGWVVPLVRQAPSAVTMETVAPARAPGSDAPRNGLPQRRRMAAGPNWKELTEAQQKILRPLEKRWPFIGEVQKRRWIVLTESFDTLPAQEQIKLRDRMESWANFSAQQRSQARLNYAITNRMAPQDKWAQWQAYQALSDEQKRALAAKAAPRPTGAAPALRPVPAKKLARVPAATAASRSMAKPPKIPTPSPQSMQSIAPHAASLPAAAETRPVHMPSVVETTPVNLSSATPVPLPVLAPSDAEASAPADLPLP